MRNFVEIILVLLFLVSCSTGTHQSSDQVLLNRKQVSHLLYTQLKKRKLQKAGQYLVFLEAPVNIKEKLLFAQYHLMACNPKQSLSYITPNMGPEKELIKAVIWGMVSIERKTKKETSHKSKDTNRKFVYPIDSGEVWPDEWRDITPLNGYCEQIPLSRKEYRKLLKDFSFKTFHAIPEQLIHRDFGLISLAVDLGYAFLNIGAILAKYKNKKENSYYKYLENIILHKNKTDQIRVEKEDKEGQFNLSTLKVRSIRMNPEKIEIPFILGDNFL